MRMIANACDIRVGNLTYHYPHKLDIVTSLLEEGHPHEAEEIESLGELYLFLQEMIDGVRKNHFFFSSSSLQEIDPLFFETNRKHVQELHDTYFKALIRLKENDIFISSFSEEEMKSIVSITMLSHLSWANEEGKNSTYTDLTFQQFLYQHILLLKPYLTKKGSKQFEAIEKIISL